MHYNVENALVQAILDQASKLDMEVSRSELECLSPSAEKVRFTIHHQRNNHVFMVTESKDSGGIFYQVDGPWDNGMELYLPGEDGISTLTDCAKYMVKRVHRKSSWSLRVIGNVLREMWQPSKRPNIEIVQIEKGDGYAAIHLDSAWMCSVRQLPDEKGRHKIEFGFGADNVRHVLYLRQLTQEVYDRSKKWNAMENIANSTHVAYSELTGWMKEFDKSLRRKYFGPGPIECVASPKGCRKLMAQAGKYTFLVEKDGEYRVKQSAPGGYRTGWTKWYVMKDPVITWLLTRVERMSQLDVRMNRMKESIQEAPSAVPAPKEEPKMAPKYFEIRKECPRCGGTGKRSRLVTKSNPQKAWKELEEYACECGGGQTCERGRYPTLNEAYSVVAEFVSKGIRQFKQVTLKSEEAFLAHAERNGTSAFNVAKAWTEKKSCHLHVFIHARLEQDGTKYADDVELKFIHQSRSGPPTTSIRWTAKEDEPLSVGTLYRIYIVLVACSLGRFRVHETKSNTYRKRLEADFSRE